MNLMLVECLLALLQNMHTNSVRPSLSSLAAGVHFEMASSKNDLDLRYFSVYETCYISLMSQLS